MPSRNELWWVYALRCTGDRYYIGASSNVGKRQHAHFAGHGSVFTRAHPPIALVGAIPVGSRSQAMTLERKVKRWPPERKQLFFSVFAQTWQRHGIASIEGDAVMTNLEVALEVLVELSERRISYESFAFDECVRVCPELVDLFSELGVESTAAATWLCTPNSYLAEARPAALIAKGETASVIGLIARSIHKTG
ncbi:MAG: GIY-YIG nuclease family protein [Xanthomonadaceae bacterium]|nr:GIY-YIG nuclease family protein [Xanthomonadaceae bacterium]